MEGQLVKGIILKSRVEYIEKVFGTDALDKMLPCLEGKTKAVFSDPQRIRATSWYDFSINLEFDEAMCKVLADGDTGIFWKMGGFTNEFQASDMSRHAYNDPWKYLTLHVGVWPRFWRPGRAELTKVNDGEALITIYDMRSTRNYCQTNIGFFHTGLELAGAKDVEVVETQCTEDPEVEHCEYRCRFKWDPE